MVSLWSQWPMLAELHTFFSGQHTTHAMTYIKQDSDVTLRDAVIIQERVGGADVVFWTCIIIGTVGSCKEVVVAAI